MRSCFCSGETRPKTVPSTAAAANSCSSRAGELGAGEGDELALGARPGWRGAAVRCGGSSPEITLTSMPTAANSCNVSRHLGAQLVGQADEAEGTRPAGRAGARTPPAATRRASESRERLRAPACRRERRQHRGQAGAASGSPKAAAVRPANSTTRRPRPLHVGGGRQRRSGRSAGSSTRARPARRCRAARRRRRRGRSTCGPTRRAPRRSTGRRAPGQTGRERLDRAVGSAVLAAKAPAAARARSRGASSGSSSLQRIDVGRQRARSCRCRARRRSTATRRR